MPWPVRIKLTLTVLMMEQMVPHCPINVLAHFWRWGIWQQCIYLARALEMANRRELLEWGYKCPLHPVECSAFDFVFRCKGI